MQKTETKNKVTIFKTLFNIRLFREDTATIKQEHALKENYEQKNQFWIIKKYIINLKKKRKETKEGLKKKLPKERKKDTMIYEV